MGQPGNGGSLIVREPAAPALFEYGIQTEDSDIRCHVAPATKLIFVFQTKSALSLDLSKYPLRPAYQPDVDYRTSEGWCVPWNDIPDIRMLRWHSIPWWDTFENLEKTTDKGIAASRVAEGLLLSGRFPLWPVNAKESLRLSVQKGGTDILLWGKWKIQVKCDFRAGPKELGGTGNIFLQKAEINPLKRR